MLPIEKLLACYDPTTGEIPGAPLVRRHLHDLRGCFADARAFAVAAAAGNPLLYTVAGVEPGAGAGDLHYGLGLLMPGKIGDEYFMTKGHLHQRREAAEVYIGLSGEGLMLLEDETSGESRMVPLRAKHVVYVPGYTAHRTVNVGATPLAYLGIYPADAGHDYGVIAKRNFRKVIVDHHGVPTMRDRTSTR